MPRLGRVIPQDKYSSQSQYSAYTLSVFIQEGAVAIGVRVTDILNRNSTGLRLVGAEDMAFPRMDGIKASYRLLLPGYEQYTHQFNIRCFRDSVSTPLTIGQAAKVLASETRRAFNYLARQPCESAEWRLGSNGAIRLDQVFLLGVIRVSEGSIQPILAVELPAVEGGAGMSG